MEFLGDPQEYKLREMQQYLRWWAWSQKERKKTGINVLYPLMMSVRRTEETEKNVRRGLVLDQKIPVTRIEKQIIARKVDKIMNDPELWRGHYRDKEILAMFYLDPSANPRGCNESVKVFSKSLRVPRWQVKNMIRSALIYFSTLYGG